MPARRALSVPLLALALLACGSDPSAAGEKRADSSPPDENGSAFLSADVRVFGWRYLHAMRGTEDAGGTARGGAVHVPWTEGRLVLLNGYRGLQVLDVADPAAPRLLGEARWQGEPVALHVDGDRALAVVANHAGVSGSLRRVAGGRIYAVDLSDAAAPTVTAQAEIAGDVVRAAFDGTSILVATSACVDDRCDAHRSALHRFSRSEGVLAETARIPLDGGFSALHLDGDRLAIATAEIREQAKTRVAIAELTPDGGLRRGGTIELDGSPTGRPAFAFAGDVLRVVLGGAKTHVATVNVSVVDRPALVDERTLPGLPDDVLFADDTVVVAQRGASELLVFSFDPAGGIASDEPLPLDAPASGLRRLADGRLLVGGVSGDPYDGPPSQAELRLYDLDARTLTGGLSWGSDRGADTWLFDEIQEDERRRMLFVPWRRVVDVLEPDGYPWSTEVLPGVDVIDLSGDNPVWRSALAQAESVPVAGDGPLGVVASAARLQSWELATARVAAELPLATAREAIVSLDDFVVRSAAAPRADRVRLESVSNAEAGNERAAPIGSIEVAPGGRAYRVGARLLAWVSGQGIHGDGSGQILMFVQVIDFADLAAPVARGTFSTVLDTPPTVHAFDRALVLGVEPDPRRDDRPTCLRTVAAAGTCAPDAPEDGCTTIVGGELCGAPAENRPCTGGFATCTWSAGRFACAPVEPQPSTVAETCRNDFVFSDRVVVAVLDLADADAPLYREVFEMPDGSFAPEIVPTADGVWLGYAEAAQRDDHPLPWLRHHARHIVVADPAHATVGEPLQIPGTLLGVEGDVFVTRQERWEGSGVRTHFVTSRLRGSTLEVESDVALQGAVGGIVRDDGRGGWLASRRAPWAVFVDSVAPHAPPRTIDVLVDAAAASSFEVPGWAELRAVAGDRALFATPDGLLAWDLGQQRGAAFLRTEGWPSSWLETDDGGLIVPQGSWGLGVVPAGASIE